MTTTPNQTTREEISGERASAIQLEADMRRYVYDRTPERRIKCLDAHNKRMADLAALQSPTDGEGDRLEWRPIESAPKDREVLIYAEKTGEQFVAFWGTAIEDGDQQWTFARGDGISFIVRNPTHWMPLPEAPAHLSRKDGE